MTELFVRYHDLEAQGTSITITPMARMRNIKEESARAWRLLL